MVQAGGCIDDMLLLPVLLDDLELLEAALAQDPSFLSHRAHIPCSFTSLDDVTLLHVAVEYGSSSAVEWLIAKGADVNARAGLGADGSNGHTPIFHAVNSNANRTVEILSRLLEAGAHTEILLTSLWWGRGFEWETVFFDVTPLSYAQMGLLPQVHRREQDVYLNIQMMLSAANRPSPTLNNVPNRYLAS
jgi:ankyrin repeat protein